MKTSGTYSHCSKCKIKKNCCCDFDDEIDNIVTTVRERDDILNRVGKSYDKFFSKINDEAYNILNINGICPFYNKGCTIYDIRPSDCKLFPYDIKKIGYKYYLILYDLPCGSSNVKEDVSDVIEILKTIINTYTDKKIEEKVSNFKYKIIKEIKL